MQHYPTTLDATNMYRYSDELSAYIAAHGNNPQVQQYAAVVSSTSSKKATSTSSPILQQKRSSRCIASEMHQVTNRKLFAFVNMVDAMKLNLLKELQQRTTYYIVIILYECYEG